MHLVANTKLIRNRQRLAGIFHIAALVVLVLGAAVSLQPGYLLASYLAMFAGLFLYQAAQSNVRRWGPRQRQDGALVRHLKGLDDRHTFVAFPSPKLPDYLVIGPAGVYVLIVRPHKATISCRADRWSIDYGGPKLVQWLRSPLGNPSAEAQAGVEAVKQHLAAQASDATTGTEDAEQGRQEPLVGAVIVFTHPDVRLRVDGCAYPVTTAKELRNHLRRTKGSLSPAQVAELRQALAPFSAE
ncbi:MAG: hypothetical protein HY690_05310 [Chloroflexi bacterium]|nr:hypothetical protein [Chloroflexota bacterium]